MALAKLKRMRLPAWLGRTREEYEAYIAWRNKINVGQRARYAISPDARKASNRHSNVKHRYGISTADRDEIFIKQGRKCGICQSDTPSSKTGWHVDHCHETGVVRGVLCQRCNNMIGNAKDNAEVLKRAITYLELDRS